jgi:predicted kinase
MQTDKEMDKKLIIVRGVPGSGKSDFASTIGRAICTADDYHVDRYGNYDWKPQNISKAHDWCKRKCKRFMKAGITPIIIANTSTTEKEFKPYHQIAKNNGYKVYSVIVENRHGGTDSHNVPVDTLEKMKNRFEVKL